MSSMIRRTSTVVSMNWDNLNNQVSQAIDKEPMVHLLDEKRVPSAV